MKKLFIILAIVLFAAIASAQETITFAWQYDAVEAQRVIEWRLYVSETSGDYTNTPFLAIAKVGDQATYTETIDSSGIPNAMAYFVLTAYGDTQFDPRESGYSNEVSYDFSNISSPFQLIITVE